MVRRTPPTTPRPGSRAPATAALVAAIALLGVAVLPVAFGFTSMLIRSGSMGRAAPVGSVVLGRHVDAGQVRIGDAVLLPRPGTPVLHRVIEVGHEQSRVVVRTQGDANPLPDATPTVLPARVVRAVATVPHVGHLLRVVRTPVGWVMFVLVPSAALCALFLRSLWAPPSTPAARGWSLPRQPAP